MGMYDIITRKKAGKALTEAEIAFFVEGFTSGEIPDYQASALLMAICLKGMDGAETALLTHYMAHSGDIVDLSPIPGVKADKHSTGGVGDKTTLIVAPIVAACGVSVAKMSGRGLGHTGGTIDKLEAIPGFKTALDKERFFAVVKETGLAVISQSGNIAPADKKLYALRDVTATVDNLSLIASSIMSKKIAAGADAILLDVKTGSGAFMKTLDGSVALAREMVAIGTHAGRSTMALVTDMDNPLGFAIGNSLEVIEAVNTLKGYGPKDLTEVCIELAAHMLLLAGKGDIARCRELAGQAIDSGEAFKRLKAMTIAQGGDASVLEDTSRFAVSPVISPFTARESGYISRIDTESFGMASAALGAGRVRKEDAVDHSAGIVIHKKLGDFVQKGEVIAQMHTASAANLPAAEKLLSEAVSFSASKPKQVKAILAAVSPDGVTMF